MSHSTSSQAANPWHRRLRRLFFFAGSVSAAYLLLSYAADRIREGRIRAQRERKGKDLIKAHFTSLISTIHNTLYALLPTLHPHLVAAYPVELTSGNLQGLQNLSASSMTSSSSNGPTPDSSMVLDRGHGDVGNSGTEAGPSSVRAGASEYGAGGGIGSCASSDVGTGLEHSSTTQESVSESWASEFRERQGGLEHVRDDDMLTVSSVSQPISLPTEASSSSPSPASDMSRSVLLHPSPPRPVRSKKELWRDLKVQIYLVPMLYILATSQLSVLARTRYLSDVQESLLENESSTSDPTATPRRSLSETTLHPDSSTHTGPNIPPRHSKAWFGISSIKSFSISAMGLGEYAESSFHPLSYLPLAIRAYVPWKTSGKGDGLQEGREEETPEAVAFRLAEEARIKAEAERNFLTYSWWILNEGWREVAARVEGAVDRVFGGMALKRELTLDDWEKYFKEVRASVETEVIVGNGSDSTKTNVEFYDFTNPMLPPSPCDFPGSPLPREPSDHSSYLAALIEQTKTHLKSPDARLLLEKGVSVLVSRLVDSIATEVYEEGIGDPGVEPSGGEQGVVKRLADCLPEINRWGQGVWEKIPDGGIETLLALPEYESFAALIFGDWAPRDA